MSPQQRISVVLPVRDEATLVSSGIQAVTGWLEGLSWELVLIDLGSVDGSAELLESFAESKNIKLVLEESSMGKGYAHRLGALLSGGAWILLADLCCPMHGTPLGRRPGILDAVDLVLFTPLHPEGQGARLTDRLTARLLRGGFLGPANMLPSDPDGSMVLLRKEAALTLFPLCDQSDQLYTYELLQLAVLEGYTFVEEPIDARQWHQAGWRKQGRLIKDFKVVRQGFTGRTFPDV